MPALLKIAGVPVLQDDNATVKSLAWEDDATGDAPCTERSEDVLRRFLYAMVGWEGEYRISS